MSQNPNEFIEHSRENNLDTIEKDFLLFELRQRYYSHLSFLDSTAKYYGEMSFFNKLFLYVAGAVTSIILLNHLPGLIVTALFWGLIALLEAQYNSLENRFNLLIQSLSDVYEQLKEGAFLHQKAKIEIFKAFEKNNELATTLSQMQFEMEHIKAVSQQKFIQMSKTLTVIEHYANEFKSKTESLLLNSNEVIKHGESFYDHLQKSSDTVGDLTNLIDETEKPTVENSAGTQAQSFIETFDREQKLAQENDDEAATSGLNTRSLN